MKLREALKKDTETKIADFFRKNEEITDDKIHAFADELEIDKHKFEETIYKMLKSLLEKNP